MPIVSYLMKASWRRTEMIAYGRLKSLCTSQPKSRKSSKCITHRRSKHIMRSYIRLRTTHKKFKMRRSRKCCWIAPDKCRTTIIKSPSSPSCTNIKIQSSFTPKYTNSFTSYRLKMIWMAHFIWVCLNSLSWMDQVSLSSKCPKVSWSPTSRIWLRGYSLPKGSIMRTPIEFSSKTDDTWWRILRSVMIWFIFNWWMCTRSRLLWHTPIWGRYRHSWWRRWTTTTTLVWYRSINIIMFTLLRTKLLMYIK